MARKKKVNHFIEGILHKYAYDFFSFLFSSLEKGVGESMERFSNFIHIKKKLQHYTLSMMLMTAGIVVALYGAATVLDTFFSLWPAGVSYLLVGIFAMILAQIYKKYS